MALLKVVNDLLSKLGEDVTDNKETEETEEPEFVVKGTEVTGKVDYEKLCDQFGCDLLTNDMIVTMDRLTGKRVHPMIRRKLYYAHRDFDKILKCHAAGKPWYLYTGRGTKINIILVFIFIRNFCSVFSIFPSLHMK